MVIALFMGAATTFGQDKTETFKVNGNCGMCETRIEKAAESVDGVKTADWDKSTKMLEVSFDALKADKDKIQKAIAKVGHDTGKYRAKDEVYESLPACCKYKRTGKKS